MFIIGGNTFYDWKNKVLMKTPEFKRSGIRSITEFCRILNGFPNQALKAAAGKPSESKKPYKKSGGNKGMAFMQSMFEAYIKSQKKAGKSKKRKKRDYDSSDSSDSE